MLNHYKEHYKLYKSGKLWVTAMLATGALVTTTTVAKADTITNSQAVQTPNAAVVSSDTNRDGKTSATGDYALSASSASANDESNVQTEKATPSDGTTTALSSNQVPQSENQALRQLVLIEFLRLNWSSLGCPTWVAFFVPQFNLKMWDLGD